MIFGDGALGPEGVFLCCAAVIIIPTVYLSAATMTSFNTMLRNNVVALLNVAVAFVIFGALFGDVVGGVVALFVALGSFSTTVFGPRRAMRRVQRIRVVRNFNFGDMVQGEDGGFFGEAAPGEKRKRADDDGEPIIIERPPEQ
jgi:hypothetical protein